MPIIVPRSTDTQLPQASDEAHTVCRCSPNMSLCGSDVHDLPIAQWVDGRTSCVVCRDLELRPCVRCGL